MFRQNSVKVDARARAEEQVTKDEVETGVMLEANSGSVDARVNDDIGEATQQAGEGFRNQSIVFDEKYAKHDQFSSGLGFLAGQKRGWTKSLIFFAIRR
jgi:hypothetical protein